MIACTTCAWWQPLQRDATRGECRFNPPQPHPGGRAVFPVTDENDWCGAHAPEDSWDADKCCNP